MSGDERTAERPQATAFVGRLDELAQLDGVVQDAERGAKSIALVGGDPGIGKSTLVRHAAELARQRGLAVAWGACRGSEGAPAYWPWSELLRACLERGDGSLEGLAPRELALLGRIAPELTGGESFELGDEHRTRFELAQAIMSFFERVARDSPLVAVLEDVHLADAGSLALLRHVAEAPAPAPIILIATHRPGELSEHAQAVIAALPGSTLRLALEPLEDGDVLALVPSLTTAAVHPSVVEAVAAAGGGNPLFTREIVRMLETQGQLSHTLSGGEIGVPGTVREVIRDRTRRLPEDVSEVVATASVLGREFDFALLGTVTGLASPTLLDHLGVAIAEGLIEAVGAAPGRYRFHHDLLRTVIYDELQAPARAELHRRVADAIESTYASALDGHSSELAHHLYEASPLVDPMRVYDAAMAAGDRAAHLLAFGTAESHYRRAASVLGSSGVEEDERHVEVLLALGSAQRRGGSRETRATLREAFAAARRIGEPSRMARAALAMPIGLATVGGEAVVDADLLAHAEEALQALGDGDAGLRARLLAAIAEERYWADPVEAAAEPAREALAIAEQLDDDAVLARVLAAYHYATWGPENTDERWDVANRMLHHARRSQSDEIAFMAHSARITAMLERGDMTAVDAELVIVERLLETLGQPIVRWAYQRWLATRAMVDGRMTEAEVHMNAAVAVADEVQHPASIIEYFGMQLWVWHLSRGTAAEIADAVRANSEGETAQGYRAALAALEAQLGNDAAARIQLDRFFVNGLDLPRRDQAWMIALSSLASATALAGTPDMCAQVLEAGLPLAERCVIVGDGTVWIGPLAQWLAPLAARAGDPDLAERLFEQALAIDRQAGALPILALGLQAYATFLAGRGGGGDSERARAFAEEAHAICRRCDLPGLEESLTSETPAPRSPDALSARLRRDGDRWIVGLAGRTASISDLRGLTYLQRLVSEPHREFHVLDLAGAPGGSAGDRSGDTHGLQGTAGPLLDAEAKAAYRRRLADLATELDEADTHGDGERAARARAEIDALTDHLASAVGLGGRDRQAGSDAERARVAVRKAVRSAVARITEHVPDLGAHLEAAVQTGAFCSYAPDPTVSVTWET